jgi:hypothetical protein
MAQRERITRLSKSWQKLTEDERKSWTEAAKEVKTKGVCGNNIELTGHQYFIRVNSLREANGDLADSTVIPAAAEFAENVFTAAVDASADITTSTVSIPLGAGAVEGQRVAIWGTSMRSAGKMAYKGVMSKYYQEAITADDITAGYLTTGAAWIAKFGVLTGGAGKAITFGCRQYIDGTYSNSVIDKAFVIES